MKALLPRGIEDAISEMTEFSDTRAGREVTPLPMRLRRAASEDLRACRLSRAAVSLELSRRAGRMISVAVIDAMVAETKEAYRFPAELIPAWTQVTGSRRVLEVVAAELGLTLATAEDVQFAEYGRADLRRHKLARMLTGDM